MTTPEQHTTKADGLEIFDDVREVRTEPAGMVGLQLLAIVLTYAVVLGLVVIVAVVVVLALTLLWPVLQQSILA